MKKTIITTAMFVALGLFAVSCSDESGGFGSGSGRIAPLVGCDGDVEGMGQTLSRAGDNITVDDLSLTLAKEDGSFRQTWEKVSDFDVEKQFGVGNYTLTAFYGDPNDEGFEKPAFSGSVPVRVADGQTSRVSLTATTTNARVSVVYSDAFQKYMTDYSGQFVTAKGTHNYVKTETRPLHVAPGQLTFNIHVVKPNGKEGNFEVAKINAQARHHYVITVDLNNGNVSDAVLEVTFDDTLEQEPVTIDISDKVLISNAPEITTEGFTEGTPVELIASVPNKNKVQLNLMAMAGFKSVTMTTQSEYLLANGWPATVDLLKANEQEQSLFTSKGLRVAGLWKNTGSMALLDFAPMAEFLTAGTASFTVSITDVVGRTLETPVTVELQLIEPELEIASIPGQYNCPGAPLNFALETNMPLTQDMFKVEYKNIRGTMGTATITGFAEGVSRSTNSYTVTIITPTDIDDDLTLKVTCGRIGSNEIVIGCAPVKVNVADNDVFATSAYMEVVSIEDSFTFAPEDVQLVFENGDSFTNATQTVEQGYYDVTALQPGTRYSVRAKIGNIYSKATTFTTETADQLPNSGMEDWSRDNGKTSYWWIDYPGSDKNALAWNTMNLLTTSEGGNSGAPGCGYCAKSGTQPTTDVHSGAKAAFIQTVGWGDGNTAWLNTIGSGIRGGKCEYLTVGQLYLGYYDSANKNAVHSGCDFTSRPSEMKFWAKYAPKNSADWGTAEIKVLAADGSTLSSNSVNISKTDNYTQFNLPLSYTRGMQKAAKVVVVFTSSGNSSCQTISNNNLSSPPSANVTTSVGYTGSSLYIDDIELIY